MESKSRRHELRKELKLLKMSNMKLKKALRLAMRVRYLNRIRLEGDVTELNLIFSKLKNSILGTSNDIVDNEDTFKNPQASSFKLRNDLETKYDKYESTKGEKPKEYKFFCNRCDFKCTKKSPFDIHMRRHTGDRPYVCNICPKSFVAKYELSLHQGMHSNKRIYCCNDCNYTTYRPDMLVNHTEKHSGIKTHQCDICDFKTDEKFRLLLHKKSHVPGGLSECIACENAKAKLALKIADNKMTDCGLNPDSLAEGLDENNVSDNNSVHTCGKRFVCKICHTSFKKRESLTKHIRTHTGERPFRCDWCDYAAAARHTLIIHQRRHSGDKPFICDQCSFRCTTKGYLKIHLNKHNGIKPFACDQCDYRSVDSCKLSEHRMVNHSSEKPFVCEICPFRAALKSRLQHHMRIHAPRPFVCPHCGRAFSTRRTLMEHEGFHTGEQPFKCDICKVEKRFTLEISHRRHMDRHKLKFSCNLCDYRTGLNKDLIRHMKVHQKPTYLPRKRSEKLVQCNLCKFRCDSVELLEKHMFVHPEHGFQNMNICSDSSNSHQPLMYPPNDSFIPQPEMMEQDVFPVYGLRSFPPDPNTTIEYTTPIVPSDVDNKDQPATDAIYNVILASFQH